MEPTDDQLQLLLAAREKARRLLEEILRHQKELDAGPPSLDAAQLQAGRMALGKAIDAATRMLQSIEEALSSIDKADHHHDEE